MKYFIVVTFFTTISARHNIPTGSYLPGSTYFNIGSVSGFSGQHNNIVTGVGSTYHGIGGIDSGFHGFGTTGGFINDQKHVYFYAAPEEYSSSRLRINVIPNSQRHTKIVFVKAPTYGGVVPEVHAPQSISEDKTLVYVLVKRPEQGGQINIPTDAGIKQSKPEVHFIKYRSQHDAQQQIVGGIQGQPVGSHVPDLGNEVNFVRTLESSSTQGIGGLESITKHTSGSFGSNVFTSGATGGTFGPAGASGPY